MTNSCSVVCSPLLGKSTIVFGGFFLLSTIKAASTCLMAKGYTKIYGLDFGNTFQAWKICVQICSNAKYD